VLLSPEKRPGGIAFIFIGWSLAAVVGIPLANVLADAIGWQFVYFAMAALSAIGLLWVWVSVPGQVFAPALNLASWLQAIANPVIVLVLAVTLFSFVGQFSIYSYIAPILKEGFGADTSLVSLGFAASGLAGLIGNTLASRHAQRLGVDRVIAASLSLIVIGLLWFGLGFGAITAAFIALALIGSGNFVSNSLQQSRLARISPAIASATIALNTTCVYLGQAIGTWTGGFVLADGVSARVAFFAAAFSFAALLFSLLAQKLASAAATR
jgi:MFS transporter, DHA1 family, inner membrane transport protein